MQTDIRDTPLYREAEALYQTLLQPGTGQISDAAEVSSNGTYAVFAGAIVDSLNGIPPTRICSTDLASGDTRVLTFGPNVDRCPKFSPDGQRVAFLSDRKRAGDFQLYLLDPASGAVCATPPVDGWVEYLHWSPGGQCILLGVAGHGADIAGGQGAVTSSRYAEGQPSWMPTVVTGDEPFHWRRAWVYDLTTNGADPVGPSDLNVWEAVWCGNDAIAAVVSSGPGEGAWYTARLRIIDLGGGDGHEVYRPKDQVGWAAASPSGAHLAIVEAVSSDRWIVAGDLRVINTASGEVQHVDTHDVDVTYTEWRSERTLLLGGHRDFETVVGLFDAGTCTFREVWSSDEITTGSRYIVVSGLNEAGDFVMVGEGFLRAPEIAVVRGGRYTPVRSFDVGYRERATTIAAVERVMWNAPDGLEIHGWVLRPPGEGPHALVMNVHGGPVSHHRPVWPGRPRSVPLLMLVQHGYAVFYPNPRGSSGRGQAFARHVLGDMGGADTYDYLSGIEHLVERGIADSKRIGVTGVSYGGFITSWLITQDPRFAAAVAVSPVTNQVTEHLVSNIPHFVAMFLADRYTNPGGKYFERSPIMHAHNVRTPTLNICGALDRCTPPEEAMQFHNALLENGVRSVLVTYPREGHGVRNLPAAIDYAARLVGWFEEHMLPRPLMGIDSQADLAELTV
jgi:dipeptidyl aminopeptidase/acylaminoacyl peptidase